MSTRKKEGGKESKERGKDCMTEFFSYEPPGEYSEYPCRRKHELWQGKNEKVDDGRTDH